MENNNNNKKICVISNTGNSGKTVISRYLLYPRMPNADVFSIETRNNSLSDLGLKNVKTYTGDQLQNLLSDLIRCESAIIDVGTSNVDAFFNEAKILEDSIDDFDLILIPVIPEEKSDEEGIRIYRELIENKVNPKKITFLPNRVKDSDEIIKRLPMLYETVKFDPTIFFPENDAIEFLSSIQISIEDLIKNGGDNGINYKKESIKAKENGDAKKAKVYSKLYINLKLIIPLKENLDFVFQEIMKDK